MSITPAEIDAIRERLNAATPGPYEPVVDENGRTYGYVITQSHGDSVTDIPFNRDFEGPHNPNAYKGIYADTTFLAYSWQDITSLLEHIQWLEDENKNLAEQMGDAYHAGEQDALR